MAVGDTYTSGGKTYTVIAQKTPTAGGGSTTTTISGKTTTRDSSGKVASVSYSGGGGSPSSKSSTSSSKSSSAGTTYYVNPKTGTKTYRVGGASAPSGYVKVSKSQYSSATPSSIKSMSTTPSSKVTPTVDLSKATAADVIKAMRATGETDYAKAFKSATGYKSGEVPESVIQASYKTGATAAKTGTEPSAAELLYAMRATGETDYAKAFEKATGVESGKVSAGATVTLKSEYFPEKTGYAEYQLKQMAGRTFGTPTLEATKTPILSKVEGAAQSDVDAKRIAMYNARVNTYNAQGMLGSSPEEKSELDAERERLWVALKDRYPYSNPDEVLGSTSLAITGLGFGPLGLKSLTNEERIKQKITGEETKKEFELLEPQIETKPRWFPDENIVRAERERLTQEATKQMAERKTGIEAIEGSAQNIVSDIEAYNKRTEELKKQAEALGARTEELNKGWSDYDELVAKTQANPTEENVAKVENFYNTYSQQVAAHEAKVSDFQKIAEEHESKLPEYETKSEMLSGYAKQADVLSAQQEDIINKYEQSMKKIEQSDILGKKGQEYKESFERVWDIYKKPEESILGTSLKRAAVTPLLGMATLGRFGIGVAKTGRNIAEFVAVNPARDIKKDQEKLLSSLKAAETPGAKIKTVSKELIKVPVKAIPAYYQVTGLYDRPTKETPGGIRWRGVSGAVDVALIGYGALAKGTGAAVKAVAPTATRKAVTTAVKWGVPTAVVGLTVGPEAYQVAKGKETIPGAISDITEISGSLAALLGATGAARMITQRPAPPQMKVLETKGYTKTKTGEEIIKQKGIIYDLKGRPAPYDLKVTKPKKPGEVGTYDMIIKDSKGNVLQRQTGKLTEKIDIKKTGEGAFEYEADIGLKPERGITQSEKRAAIEQKPGALQKIKQKLGLSKDELKTTSVKVKPTTGLKTTIQQKGTIAITKRTPLEPRAKGEIQRVLKLYESKVRKGPGFGYVEDVAEITGRKVQGLQWYEREPYIGRTYRDLLKSDVRLAQQKAIDIGEKAVAKTTKSIKAVMPAGKRAQLAISRPSIGPRGPGFRPAYEAEAEVGFTPAYERAVSRPTARRGTAVLEEPKPRVLEEVRGEIVPDYAKYIYRTEPGMAGVMAPLVSTGARSLFMQKAAFETARPTLLSYITQPSLLEEARPITEVPPVTMPRYETRPIITPDVGLVTEPYVYEPLVPGLGTAALGVGIPAALKFAGMGGGAGSLPGQAPMYGKGGGVGEWTIVNPIRQLEVEWLQRQKTRKESGAKIGELMGGGKTFLGSGQILKQMEKRTMPSASEKIANLIGM